MPPCLLPVSLRLQSALVLLKAAATRPSLAFLSAACQRRPIDCLGKQSSAPPPPRHHQPPHPPSTFTCQESKVGAGRVPRARCHMAARMGRVTETTLHMPVPLAARNERVQEPELTLPYIVRPRVLKLSDSVAPSQRRGTQQRVPGALHMFTIDLGMFSALLSEPQLQSDGESGLLCGGKTSFDSSVSHKWECLLLCIFRDRPSPCLSNWQACSPQRPFSLEDGPLDLQPKQTVLLPAALLQASFTVKSAALLIMKRSSCFSPDHVTDTADSEGAQLHSTVCEELEERRESIPRALSLGAHSLCFHAAPSQS
ncbi:hypothetical protein JZ751_026118, partial [Albula glossodonta]